MNLNNLNNLTLTLNSEDKKSRIMAATIELVSENGIHATPMSKVSNRASVAAGTIYHYFDNKDALIREAFFTIKSLHIDIVKQEMNNDIDFKTQFFTIWKSIYQCLLIPGHLSFIEQCGVSPLIDEDTLKELEEMADPVIVFFNQGKQQKIIKDIPDRLLFQLIFGSASSLAKINKIGERLQLTDELVEQAAQFTWDGIKRA